MFGLRNDELERNGTLRKCYLSLTIENNLRVKIHRCLYAAYEEENVMNPWEHSAMAVNVPRKESKHTQ